MDMVTHRQAIELEDRPTTGAAWITLDCAGVMRQCSASALRMLSACDDAVQASVGRRIAIPARQQALDRLLRLGKANAPSAMLLPRSGRLPLTLHCTATGRHLLMELTDPEAWHIGAPVLQAIYGLTRTEADIAAALCDGRSPGDIAASMGVQTNTVSVHIKHVLAKTGTTRQAELVALLWRCAARITP
jgi:DNA-binding CsgD family transcriptional regulator